MSKPILLKKGLKVGIALAQNKSLLRDIVLTPPTVSGDYIVPVLVPKTPVSTDTCLGRRS